MLKRFKLHPNIEGAIWMTFSGFAFVGMAAIARYLGPTESVATMIFWRAIAGVFVTLPFALGKNLGVWKIKRPGKILMRSFWGTLAFFTSFYSFAHLPLAQAQALSFSRSLFITILAVFILGEKVAWRRWSAIAIGFIGVIFMTYSPQTGFNLISLDFATICALLSAFFFAITIVTLKELTADHSAITLVLYANVLTAISGIPFLIMDPSLPSLQSIIPLIGLGLTGIMAQNCYVRGISLGDASLMGLMDYIRLPISAIVGFMIFAEKPSFTSLFGAFIVIASTIYITLRESQLGKVKTPISDL